MYRDLEVWKDAVSLIKVIYKISDDLPKTEEYNIKSQMKRAIISVALNIAEGKTRKSSKEFAHFLNLSLSSLHEVEAILYICEELNFLSGLDEIHNKIQILGKRISALRSKLLKDA